MDVFELQAKLSLDSKEYERGLDSAKGKMSQFGEMLKANVASDLISRGMNVAVEGTKKAARAFANLAKESVSAYSDYEQMTGGIRKLYGNMGQSLEEYAQANGQTVAEARGQWQTLENAQNEVMKNADKAWKTAGMSANKYMETATSFSASLINSLGGDVKKAADQTEVAMEAISDNVNTFGSDFQSVQNAFQGFAKQNYTMLDNLKLGYGGTKEEMQRLIDDANEWGKANGEASNLSIESFSDVVTAIQQIQEKQNIAGTTAREAMTTIEGSANATKAAWENVKTAIAGGGDVGTALDNLATALFGDKEGEGLLNQLIPRVQKTMEGISDFIVKITPVISERLPQIMTQIEPALESMMDAISSILQVLLPAILPAIQQAISAIMPSVVQMAITLGGEFIKGLVSALSDMGPVGAVIGTAFAAFVGVKVVDGIKGVVTGVQGLVGAAKAGASGIAGLVGKFTGLGSNAASAAESVASTGSEIADVGSKAGTAASGIGSAASGFGAMAGQALKIVAVGAALALVGVGIKLIADSAVNIANAGPDAGIALAGIAVGIAGMAAVLAVLGPALTASAVGLIAFGASVTLIGTGIAIASAGIALLATKLPLISTYGGAAATALGLLALGVTKVGAGALVAATGVAAMILPMVGGAVSVTSFAAAMTLMAGSMTLAAAGTKLLELALTGAANQTKIIDSSAKSAMTSIKSMNTSLDVVKSGLKSFESALESFKKKFADAFKTDKAKQDVTIGMTSIIAVVTTLGAGIVAAQKVTMANFVAATVAALTVVTAKFSASMAELAAQASNAKISFNHDIAVPHFSISGKFDPEKNKVPKVNVAWYAKAMDNPYILSGATIFGATKSGLLGGGEAGEEAVVGTNRLAQIVRDNSNNGDIIVPVYIGQERIDEIIVKASQRANYRSGGR